MTDYALECFEAALSEGWIDALANGDIELIRDLWTRRISCAHEALRSGPEYGDGPEFEGYEKRSAGRCDPDPFGRIAKTINERYRVVRRWPYWSIQVGDGTWLHGKFWRWRTAATVASWMLTAYCDGKWVAIEEST